MRIEDLDQPRVVPGMADNILRTLESFGLLWDGEVVWQSRREALYQAALERLTAAGAIYPCGCSRAEIAQLASAPHGEGEVAYPGTCRAGLAPGKVPRAFRVMVPQGPICFDDGIIGRYCQDLPASCGDFVVKRADGPFAYHLAVVVDDEAMGVTQVVRGADLLASTPRQIHLQRLLGYRQPTYGHLPLVTGPGGGKLSKRDNAVSIGHGRDLAREGGRFLAAALGFLGQDLPVDLSTAPAPEMLAWARRQFDPARIPVAGGPLLVGDRDGGSA